MRDEMVMVGENSLGFELLVEVACDCKEVVVQHMEPVCATEVMCLFVGAGGDEERAARRKLMRRRMRPRSIRLGHGETLSRWRPHTQYWARVSGRPKAVEDYRSPKCFATIKATGKSARSWTAPVLWRFGSSIGLATGESSSQVYARSAKSGRGLPQSKTLREDRGRR